MRKKLFYRKPVNYTPVIVLQAAIVTVAFHAVLFLLTGYQPEKRSVLNSDGTGVTLLNLDTSSADAKKLNDWLSIHDPAHFANSGSKSGYMAYLQSPVAHNNIGSPPHLNLTLPEERHPNFHCKPLSPLPAGKDNFYEDLLYIPGINTTVDASLSLKLPQLFNRDNQPISLSCFAQMVDRGANSPTVVQCRKKGEVVRLTLISGSGDKDLDSLALQALAGSGSELPEREELITIYWPRFTDGGRKK